MSTMARITPYPDDFRPKHCAGGEGICEHRHPAPNSALAAWMGFLEEELRSRREQIENMRGAE